MSGSQQLPTNSQSTSTRNGYWTPAMTRVILDCIDEAAGNKSVFITNRNAAIQMALTRLQPVTDAVMYARLDGIKILNKLSKQAQLGGCQSITEFLQQGTEDIDLSKLQKGTYSDSEIRDADQRRQIKQKKLSHRKNAKSSNNQNTTEAAKPIDEKEKDEYPNKRTKLSQPTAPLQNQDYSQKSTKSKRNATKTITYAEVSEISDSQSSDQEDNGRTRDLQRRVGSNSSARSRSKVVFVCEICNESFQAKDGLLNHKPSHEQSTMARSTSQSSFQVSNTSQRGYPNPDELAILELATSKRGGEHTDVEVIRSQMTNIQADIFDQTKLFLISSKIDANTIVPLRIDSHEEPLNELLRTIFGSGPIDHPIRLGSASTSPVFGIGRREIILATIGCAITDWALRPLPQGEVRDGVLGEMNGLLRDRSPVFQDTVMEMATCQYLEKHVKHLVHGFAHVFAHDLFHLLRHFLPAELQQDSFQWPSDNIESHVDPLSKRTSSEKRVGLSGVVSVPSEPTLPTNSEQLKITERSLRGFSRTVPNERAQVDAMLGDEPSNSQPSYSEFSSPARTPPQHMRGPSKWPPRTQKHPTRIFLESLQRIFESALNLRLDMEMKGNAKYEFRFPRSGVALDLGLLVVHNKANNRKVQVSDLEELEMSVDEPQKKILVGLTPIVHGRFRKGDRGGGWREEASLISKGCVHIYDV